MSNVVPINEDAVKEWPIMPMVAGNWKMNGVKDSLGEIDKLKELMEKNGESVCDILICPPFTLISDMAKEAEGASILVGAQDCHANASGAHTGDISTAMLKDAGATYIIVGHSERRTDHGESDSDVLEKARAVQAEGLVSIVCIGETKAERDAGKTLDVVLGQLGGSVPLDAQPFTTLIAYEPVWAIGTGVTPTVEDVTEVHAAIRKSLVARFSDIGNGFRILYGGSVKASNAAELMAIDNVNGALVGGASLKAEDFDGIINAYR